MNTLKKRLRNVITKLFISTEKLQSVEFSPRVRNLHMEILMLIIIKPRAQRLLSNGIPAVANDDIDITQRYGENGFYLQHYTTQGKPAGTSWKQSRGYRSGKSIRRNTTN
jgi:hypothetical protein